MGCIRKPYEKKVYQRKMKKEIRRIINLCGDFQVVFSPVLPGKTTHFQKWMAYWGSIRPIKLARLVKVMLLFFGSLTHPISDDLAN